MSTPIAPVNSQPRRWGRSSAAVAVGIVVGAVLSLGTDQVLHVLHVYPPWGEPMYEPKLNLLALSYRIVFAILASYIIARMAPYSPMRHALVGGLIGFVVSLAGAIAAIPMNLGPTWYPIVLALTALPCAWLGGILYRVTQET
ncbi:MAG TPA: hypothetical protein VF387_06980 [Gemmatimonadaceae bacterium]